MKRKILTFAFAALSVGLLGSCSKINERIDGLDKKIYELDYDRIATINAQIANINSSIADLETIRTNIRTLTDATTAQGNDIVALKAADITLEGKISDLRTYTDTELANYTDWANATFATLDKQEELSTDVAKLKQDLAGLDNKLDQEIANLESSLKTWVNEQLNGYCTLGKMNEEITALQGQIDGLKTDNETNKANLAQLKQDLADAKVDIKTAYEKAIKDAIEGNDGYINETIKNAINDANGKITALTGRVDDLETAVASLQAMIQSVTIIPAYSDGCVKSVRGILTIDLVVSPAAAVEGVTKDSVKVLTTAVKTKSAGYTIIPVSSATVDKTTGDVTITADISSVTVGRGETLSVALNVKNGISDYTTEFATVFAANPEPPADALPGLFTVADDGAGNVKKVYFSKGNLYYDGSKWGFESEQYYFRTYEGSGKCDTEGYNKESGTASGHWGLFGWSTESTNFGMSTSKNDKDYSGDFIDWGKAYCESNGITEYTWATLTGGSDGEWKYLFDKHVNVWGTCNSVYGRFIAPDGFQGDSDDLSAAISNWEDAQADGIVFLPAVGWRNNSTISDLAGSGLYWSSCANESNKAYRLYFSKLLLFPGLSDNRHYGNCVRLVTECK